MKKTVLLLLSLPLLIPASAQAAITQAGYYDRTLQLRRSETGECSLDPSRFMAQWELGTSPTYATAIGEPDDPYLLADCAGALAVFARANGTKLIIDVTDILFDPAVNRDLRPEYKTLMQTFFERAQASANVHGEGLSSSNVITAVIHNEAGNATATRFEINAAIEEWDLYYPDIPTTAGYPVSNAAQPLPQMFPYRLDYVATWDYDTFAPLDQDDPTNRGRIPFYDPAVPVRLDTKWGDFLSRLHPYQKVLLVIPAWYGCWQKDNGWRRWHLKYVAGNFCRFAQERPEIELVTVWLWESYPPTPVGERCPGGGVVDYQIEGTAQLIDTGILPFHDAIFDLAAGTGTGCP